MLVTTSVKLLSATSHSHNYCEITKTKKGKEIYPSFLLRIITSMNDFFNNYREFVENNEMKYYNPAIVINNNTTLRRLNLRYQAFFKYPEMWNNSTVLDIGGYDGRWSFAALKNRAKHTTIFEMRKASVDKGIRTFKDLNISDSCYEFVNDDILTWKPTKKYDVVICAGFLSHIYDHPKLFSIIRECDPNFLIIDSVINSYQGQVVIPIQNIVADGNSNYNQSSFIKNDGTYDLWNWTAVLSKDAIFAMLKVYDFEVVENINWAAMIDQNNTTGLEDYWTEQRITLICKRTSGWRWDRKSFINK
jgi:2-polyprenyl-3-methyl-5-hydroxy-6-metoxy-1,4-benzoquinol methylase